MFQQFFGDDEHTAADGVYIRLIKGRKWLYVSGAIGFLEAFRLISYSKASALFAGIVTIPSWMAAHAILGGLIYAVLQYSLLLVQAWEAYPSVLTDRLEKGLLENADRLRREEREASDAVQAISTALRKAQSDLRGLTLAEPLNASLGASSKGDSDQLRATKSHVSSLEGQLKTAEEALAVARSQVRRLGDDAPQKRLGFMAAEVLLDTVRVMPPYAFAIAALAHLLLRFWRDAGSPHFYS